MASHIVSGSYNGTLSITNSNQFTTLNSLKNTAIYSNDLTLDSNENILGLKSFH